MTSSNSSGTRYYVNTVSLDHLQRGVDGGFTQANHGRITGLERLRRYQVEMTATFHPWRRRVDFLASEIAPIRPLIERLDFSADKQHWGMPFRRGLFEISKGDFDRIARAMKA